jgi:hypothetical protein
MAAPSKDASLVDSAGRIFGKTRPTYADYDISQFVSLRTLGAKGDGSTDDTSIIQNALDTYAGCKVLFFDAGVYIVTSTSELNPRVINDLNTNCDLQSRSHLALVLLARAGPLSWAVAPRSRARRTRRLLSRLARQARPASLRFPTLSSLLVVLVC